MTKVKLKNVLSLFDGMSCGQIALNKVGIEYDTYFSSEIDIPAKRITYKNYPNTKFLGDVKKLKGDKLKSIGEVDLLIGGSPCQGFSFNGKQLNFKDKRSALFFEYVRILREVKPKYFLLENVAMKKEYEDVITKYLGVQPRQINSRLFSPQNRVRIYWTNIPVNWIISPKRIRLKDILEDASDSPVYSLEKAKNIRRTKNYYKYQLNANDYRQSHRVYYGSTAPCLLNDGCKPKLLVGYNPIKFRFMLPVEAERLQTVPENYTEGVSDVQRFKMLGNGWTVDVIAHIFKHIT